MAISDTITYKSRGISFRINDKELPGVSDMQGLAGGQSSEIDVTTLKSKAVEVAIGLTDAGSINIAGMAPLHDATFNDILRDANINGKPVSVKVTIGNVPDNKDYTDGSGSEVKKAKSSHESATISVTAGVAIIPFENSDLPGTIPGDYVRLYSGPNTFVDYIISATAISGSTANLSVKSASGTPLTGTIPFSTNHNDKTAIIRPAVQYRFSAFVPQCMIDLRTNDMIRYSAGLRATGKIEEDIGTPNISPLLT